jgi:hypothetical protein
MDPSPFLDRDLDHDAEEFIVSRSRELPRDRPVELVVHLATPAAVTQVAETESAVQHYFATRADMKRREFRLLLRNGHISLTIGLVFLTGCLLASGVVARLPHAQTVEVIREGLVIAGWVAMWRPLQTYLYDWWPLRTDWQILQRLSRMHVRLVLPPSPEPRPASTPRPEVAA